MPWPKGDTTETLQYSIWTALKELGTDDKDGWFVYDEDGRKILAEKVGVADYRSIQKNVSNMIRNGYLEDVRDTDGRKAVIGLRPTDKQPWRSHKEMQDYLAIHPAERPKRAKAAKQQPAKPAQTAQTNGAAPIIREAPAVRNDSEYLPENLATPNFESVDTPVLNQYDQAKALYRTVSDSPFLSVSFAENSLAEEALQLRDNLNRAQQLLKERTDMLNRSNRERNYLTKVRNPQLTTALQAAGVMVKHGD